MSEEESTSVLGGLYDAASSAASSVGNFAESQYDAAAGVFQIVGSGEASIAAGAAYAVGAYDTAREFDSDARGLSQEADQSFAESDSELQQAGQDIWGN